MAPRLIQYGNSTPVALFSMLFLVMFVFLIGKHYEIGMRDVERALRYSQNALVVLGNNAGLLDTCGPDAEFTTFSSTVFVCNSGNEDLVYDSIYNTYPASNEGKERIYSFLDQGDMERADEMLEDVYFLERYEPVTLTPPLTWTADPFEERYWRFLFYGLRPLRHLIAAGQETNNPAYYNKMREILGSFAESGMDAPYSWDDYHSVAFRTMMLVNAWWKLREAGELPAPLSDKILAMLEEHGDFLLEPTHYEPTHNHGITQATALLILAENFPDLENAPIWRAAALERIETGLRDVIDEDGVLVENSPYYHFYVLEKYWEIERYADAYGIEISEDFESTIGDMITHAVYILQPDLDMPLLGASIPRTIQRSGEFREIANASLPFRYVMSQGKEGVVPANQHMRFPSSGIAILRSGWGTERPYVDELHVTFDTGPYRTDHSDYDALGISVFAEGQRILQDAGLYTYEEDHEFFNYFHGTRGHNTVMVDNTIQPEGGGVSSEIQTGPGYAYLSAYHDLYQGVRHHRAVMIIEEGGVLVIDKLRSSAPHTYSQLFHLSPRATITDVNETTTVSARIEDGNTAIPIQIMQFGETPTFENWHGDRENLRGLCATAYEVATGCPELSYTLQDAEADFITFLRIGDAVEEYTVTHEANRILVQTPTRSYDITIEEPESGLFDSSFIALNVQTETQSSETQTPFERVVKFFDSLF